MGKQATIQHIYALSAKTLWEDLVDLDALAQSMRDTLTYKGLPKGQVREGQEFTVRLLRWGVVPMGRWTMKIVTRDDAHFRLASEEWGGPVRLYKHRLQIEVLGPQSCRYTDYLDLEAGWLTPFIFPLFKAMYQQRHLEREKRLTA